MPPDSGRDEGYPTRSTFPWLDCGLLQCIGDVDVGYRQHIAGPSGDHSAWRHHDHGNRPCAGLGDARAFIISLGGFRIPLSAMARPRWKAGEWMSRTPGFVSHTDHRNIFRYADVPTIQQHVEESSPRIRPAKMATGRGRPRIQLRMLFRMLRSHQVQMPVRGVPSGMKPPAALITRCSNAVPGSRRRFSPSKRGKLPLALIKAGDPPPKFRQRHRPREPKESICAARSDTTETDQFAAKPE